MTHEVWKRAVRRQFGAAIDMLEGALRACPDELWDVDGAYHRYWYMAYHTLFWLDYYLADDPESFRPPPPYTLGELDPAGALPERTYTKAELLDYLAHGRARCHAVIDAMTAADAAAPNRFDRADLTAGEMLLYNLRHVQHHTAQLNMLLRLQGVVPPRWVGKSDG